MTASTSDQKEGRLVDPSELGPLITQAFPPVLHAFGYGSGVFVQQQEKEQKMVDVILVVDDALDFHAQLLARHPQHYSLPCRLGGASFCAHVQNGFGANVFFHAFVEVEGLLIKYGIVEKKHILDDLSNWTHLYLAGRLHKPTLPLLIDPEVMEAQVSLNLPRALATSMVLIDEMAREQQSNKASLSSIFESIAQLSYSGDPRMDVGGEDPDKVKKLVHGNEGQMARFRQLYQPALNDFSQRGLLSFNNDDSVEWDAVPLMRETLPPRMVAKAPTLLAPAIRATVRQAARAQSLKGIVTAGVAKSVQYAFAKLSKGLLR
jgi:translocator assembly and maintenance protein 41